MPAAACSPRPRVRGSGGLSDAPLSSVECVGLLSGGFVAPHSVDDSVGEVSFVGSQVCSGAVAGRCVVEGLVGDPDDNAAVNLTRYATRQHLAGSREGTQHSWGCVPSENSGGERLSGHKTSTVARHRLPSEPPRAGQTATMREGSLRATNPATGKRAA